MACCRERGEIPTTDRATTWRIKGKEEVSPEKDCFGMCSFNLPLIAASTAGGTAGVAGIAGGAGGAADAAGTGGAAGTTRCQWSY